MARCWRNRKGLVDGLFVNVDVRGMVMVAGVLSLEEDAKTRREKRVKTEKSKEVEEVMASEVHTSESGRENRLYRQ